MSQQYKLGKLHTTVTRQGESTIVTFHTTPVVTFGGKKVTLDTGGWFTPTTKTRMNQASRQFGLGFSVFQKKGKWCAEHKGRLREFVGNVLNLED